MRTLLLFVLTGFVLPQLAGETPPEYASSRTYGAGTMTCGKWTSDLRNRTSHAVELNWVLGFMSGVSYLQAAYEGMPFHDKKFKATDKDGMERFVSTYCANNPLQPLDRAAHQMVIELLPRVTELAPFSPPKQQ